jgi:hypothetical protein
MRYLQTKWHDEISTDEMIVGQIIVDKMIVNDMPVDATTWRLKIN